MSEDIEPDKLEAFSKFKLLNPERCERCDKALDECTHEEPEKAGLFFWNGHFYCDSCLLQFGKEEAERRENE